VDSWDNHAREFAIWKVIRPSGATAAGFSNGFANRMRHRA
jgi:hypothetical protein